MSDAAQALTPLLTRKLIEFVAVKSVDSGYPIGKGVGYALGTAGMQVFTSVFLNIFFFRAMLTGAQSRAVFSQAIYEKSLRLSGKARLKYTNGLLTNLMSTDAHRIDFALQWVHFAWTFPVTLVICVALVIVNIGAIGLIGFVLLLISFFVVLFVSRRMVRIRKASNVVTDSRVGVMREVLQSMKIIKFYAWEDAYIERIFQVRNKEMHLIKLMLVVRNFLNALFVSVPTLAGLVAFVALKGIGGDLNPATVFSSLSLFNITRIPLMFLPLAAVSGFEAFLAVQRIEDLLGAPEGEHYVEYDANQKPAIRISGGSFIWEKEDEEDSAKDKDNEKKEAEDDSTDETASVYASSAKDAPAPVVEPILAPSSPPQTATEKSDAGSSSPITKDEAAPEQFTGFSNLDLEINEGEFVIVTGSIGSGKSSLLTAIAGGMHRVGGSVTLKEDMVLCGQQWVQNATVEENITFGRPMDREWYEKVIAACSLTRDLEILPAGDQTEVGERGITISGGQKARINLARAAYSNANIVLLDDVLSAVDAHVGRHIVENCINGILKGKTRLLATHQLGMLSYADRVIYLDAAGRIEIGTVDELTTSSEGFRSLLHYSQQQESEEEDASDGEDKEEEHEAKESKPKSDGKLMQAEEKATENIPLHVYMSFFKHGRFIFKYMSLPFLLLTMTISVFLTLFTSVWLSFWTANKFPARSESFYVGLFVMFGVLSAIMSFLLFYIITDLVNRTALRVHVEAVERVLHAPMSFFDTQPLGRVMNRFTKDSDSIDNELSDQARLFLYSMAIIIGTFILTIIYLPWFALSLGGLFFVFLGAAKFYRASARDIKRYESLGRSVVFAHFSESLSGLTTIKSYNDESRFINRSKSAIDKMDAAYYLTLANQRWLALRLDMVGAALGFVSSMLCVTGQFHIDASSVGLVVSSLIQVTGMLSMCVRQLASVENNMNSVERLTYYAEELPQEAPYRIEAAKPSADWPQQGAIEFKQATLRYQPQLPPVLKNLDLSVKGAEKIGICGRTGAGKSTIMVALYRLSELSEGSIEIDGVDISKIGLQDLREKLSIIPQDPVLFKGTVRSNIDPFGKSTDVELWDALRRAWLIESHDIDRVHNGALKTEQVKFHLDQNVDDDGTNFSLGERQLLALARALVRKSNILILDEATSSVDFETDHRIQSTIKNEFSNYTILCIAHRLNTILGYDRILVLDAGEVAEFDDPITLFNKPDGAFRSMCDRSGITLDDVLREQAEREETLRKRTKN